MYWSFTDGGEMWAADMCYCHSDSAVHHVFVIPKIREVKG